MPKKAFERYFSHVMPYAFLKCPKIEEFQFRFIFCFKIDHVCFNAPLFYVRFFKYPIFQNQIGKNWVFQKRNEHKKLGHLKKHVISFKTEKEPKLKFFDFGAFKNAYAIT